MVSLLLCLCDLHKKITIVINSCLKITPVLTPLKCKLTSKDLGRLGVELLVKAVQTVDIALGLSTSGTELEPELTAVNGLVHLSQALDTDILERVLNTGHEVWHKLGDRTTVLNGSRDTLSNKDAVALGEVAGGTSVAGLGVGVASSGLLVLHGSDTAHTAVGLDKLTVTADEVLSGRLGGTSKETTHHDGGRAHGKTLDNVTNVLDTAVRNARNTKALGELSDVVDGCGLGTTDSHDLLGDAGTSTAHADTETVGTSSNKSGSLVASDDVSANHIKTGEVLLDVLDHLDLVHGVTLTGVEDDNVETGINELLQTDLVLLTRADSGSSDQLLRVRKLGGEGVVQVLHQVRARQKRNEVEVLVDDRELALLRLVEDAVGLLQVHTVGGSDEIGGHDRSDGVVDVVVELDVTRSDDTNELGAKLAVLCQSLLVTVCTASL